MSSLSYCLSLSLFPFLICPPYFSCLSLSLSSPVLFSLESSQQKFQRLEHTHKVRCKKQFPGRCFSIRVFSRYIFFFFFSKISPILKFQPFSWRKWEDYSFPMRWKTQGKHSKYVSFSPSCSAIGIVVIEFVDKIYKLQNSLKVLYQFIRLKLYLFFVG